MRYTYTGTVTVVTKHPEKPRGVAVEASTWPVAARNAVYAALARRKQEGVKHRPVQVVVKLTRAAAKEDRSC